MGPMVWDIMDVMGWDEAKQDRYTHNNGDITPVAVSMPDWENSMWVQAGSFERKWWISIESLDMDNRDGVTVIVGDDPQDILDNAEKLHVGTLVRKAIHKWMWG